MNNGRFLSNAEFINSPSSSVSSICMHAEAAYLLHVPWFSVESPRSYSLTLIPNIKTHASLNKMLYIVTTRSGIYSDSEITVSST